MRYILAVFSIAWCISGVADTNKAFRMDFPAWAPMVRGGLVYHFETDVDKGGAFSVNRYFVEGGVSRIWRFDRMLSFSAGFGQDDYRFSGGISEPWNNIDNYRAGIFARWALDNEWVLFAGPSIRTYGEPGVNLEDALTAAFFGGASYKISDQLTLGPGLGVVGQLEDDTRFFPIILINWNITQKLSLETGGGFAATGGPGLSLNYAFSKRWKAGLAGRYEKKRFRLDDSGIAPGGVGEDENFPLYGIVSCYIYPGGMINAIFGYNFGGKLEADKVDGQNVYSSGYNDSVSAGVTASFRF